MQAITEWDFAVLDALQKIHNTFLNYFFAVFTYMGAGGMIWIVLTLGMLYFKKSRRVGMTSAAGLLTVLAINEGFIKNTVKRIRPFVINPAVDTIVAAPSSYSFPSGHSCTAFTVSTVIFLRNKKLGIISYAVSVLIAFSRNYFYIHYPTDVLAGMLEGILFGVLCTKIVEKVAEAKEKKKLTEEKG